MSGSAAECFLFHEFFLTLRSVSPMRSVHLLLPFCATSLGFSENQNPTQLHKGIECSSRRINLLSRALRQSTQHAYLHVRSFLQLKSCKYPPEPFTKMPPTNYTPSLLTIYAPSASHQTHQPEPTLRLSLPLAQNIHALILSSRELASLENKRSREACSDIETAMHMGQLEAKISSLRKRIESELETAWVNAGLLQSVNDMTALSLNSSAQQADKENAMKPPRQQINTYSDYTIDEELRRQKSPKDPQSEPTYEAKGRKKRKLETKKAKKGKKATSSHRDKEDEDRLFPQQIQPIGVTLARIPLSWAHRQRMRMFQFCKGRKRTRDEGFDRGGEELWSPMGTKYVD
ncbi:uncharacterized protein EI97DRAFT_440608 [Westerdykella ornata]|uniref:Uncharacterized protein n=1 Tax=Westerdykella ornata TaxID=318751 RepID=A0A6A6JTR1_WESOR|nr:uncharacterized protein EI97DRAFT_440608 [Westerdykella ornata]KAF2279146.1 hypothetical protein EI97DRAFT_440608 [Westerdykella ornata]